MILMLGCCCVISDTQQGRIVKLKTSTGAGADKVKIPEGLNWQTADAIATVCELLLLESYQFIESGVKHLFYVKQY